MKRFIVLDLEASGLNPDKGDVMIDLAAVRVDEHGMQEEFQSLLNPGDVPISDFIVALTGISRERLAQAPDPKDVLEQFKTFLGPLEDCVIIGHNISFDANFLSYYGLKFQDEQLLDTNDFATLFFPEAPSHSLEVLSDMLGIIHEEKHTALSDVKACYHLLSACHTVYQEQYKSVFADAVDGLRKQCPQYGGFHFFDMTIPSYDLTLMKTVGSSYPGVLPEVDASRWVFHPAESGGIPKAYQACDQAYERVTHVMGKDELKRLEDEHVLERSQTFTHLGQYLSKQKLASLQDSPELASKYGLLLLRTAMFPLKDSFMHVDEHAFTHRERRLLKEFSMLDEQDEVLLSEFREYLHAVPSLTTSLQEYLYGTFASVLQERKHVCLYGLATLEAELANASSRFMGYEFLSTRLQGLFESCPSGDVASDLHTLQYITKYFFEHMGKSLKGRDTMMITEEQERLDTYVSQFAKGATLVIEELEKLNDGDYIINALTSITASLEQFAEQDDAYHVYIEDGYSGISLKREKKSIEQEVALLTSTIERGIDTMYVPRFRYLLPVEGVNHQFRFANLAFPSSGELASLETEDVPFIKSRLNLEQKTLILDGSSGRLEKVFDELYGAHHGESYYVGMVGKSGGFGKVSYNFNAYDHATLLAQYRQKRSQHLREADVIYLMKLPFIILSGLRVAEVYGRRSFFDVTMPLTYKAIMDMLGEIHLCSSPETMVVLADPRLTTKQYGKELKERLTHAE